MAVDKMGESMLPSFMAIVSGRVSLENALVRFDEQMSQTAPAVVRQRLKKKVRDIKVNIVNNPDAVKPY